ncbi:hypothetical protein HFO63_18070 [Rhizobium laguerreae]|nr:hypothetical protein [Rhizobium laguerreae]MBY3069661.1 hypothetical protein [Rhizobium laguerreae]MBY3087053.1 hypothetical protein [Rhizobium laguerreae]MBY3089894.1 hypothetical protein [Rhizobium laguerreae]MBY3099925.1 hypothetical protein [Rhizobium laguerreae]
MAGEVGHAAADIDRTEQTGVLTMRRCYATTSETGTSTRDGRRALRGHRQEPPPSIEVRPSG